MAETNIKDVKLKIGTETQFQSKLKDLPINTLVGTTDPIQEGELDTSIITKLNKADNALPKPTNDSTGSAGQVLKKTANGSEWGDAPSGGGKLYRHVTTGNQGTTSFDFITYSTQQTSYTTDEIKSLIQFKYYPCHFYSPINGDGVGCISYQIGAGYIFSALMQNNGATKYLYENHETLSFNDTVTEV